MGGLRCESNEETHFEKPFFAQFFPRQRFCSGYPELFLQFETVAFFSQTWICDPPQADWTRPMIGAVLFSTAAISVLDINIHKQPLSRI